MLRARPKCLTCTADRILWEAPVRDPTKETPWMTPISDLKEATWLLRRSQARMADPATKGQIFSTEVQAMVDQIALMVDQASMSFSSDTRELSKIPSQWRSESF